LVKPKDLKLRVCNKINYCKQPENTLRLVIKINVCPTRFTATAGT